MTTTIRDTSSTHAVSMSIQNRAFAMPIKMPAFAYDDLVYTVCVEPR